MEFEIIRAGDIMATWRKKLKEERSMAKEVVHDREDLMINLERSVRSGQAICINWRARICGSEEFVAAVVLPLQSVGMGPVESSQGDPFIL